MNPRKNTFSYERLASDRIYLEVSDRRFGLSMAAVFFILGLWRFVEDSEDQVGWFLVTAFLALLVVSIVSPSGLKSLKNSWLKWGEILSRYTTPLILGFFYLTILSLYSVLMRSAGSFKGFKFRDDKLNSYWVSRKSPKQDSRDFKFQF